MKGEERTRERAGAEHLFQTRKLGFAGVVLLVFLAALPAAAQVFIVEAGSSSLYQAHGGTVTVRSPRYELRLSSGFLDKPRFGGSLRTAFRGYTFTAGDDAIPLRIPTDLFNPGHYFLGRGLGVAGGSERIRFYGFAGATSTGVSTPYLRGGTMDSGVGLFFFDAQLNERWRYFSRNIFAREQTTLHGVEYLLRPGITTAVTAGLGGNQGYFASSVGVEREWMSLQASYTRAGDRFRRIVVESPVNVESDRENIHLILKPRAYFSLSFGRQNFLGVPFGGQSGERGAVNTYGATAIAAGFRVVGRFFDSQVRAANRSQGFSLLVARDVFQRVHASVSVLHSNPARAGGTTSLVFSFRETISPRLSLSQFITRAPGNTGLSFGGQFLSNRFSVGVDYQTIFVPFLGQNQFKQALVVNVRLQLAGNVQLNAGTYVLPDGRVRYTAYGSNYLYRGAFGGMQRTTRVALYPNVVRGQVVDESGRALRGVALRVDGDVVFTDSNGQFFVRKRKAQTYNLTVLLDQFLVPGRYEVVSAPATVTSVPEDKAQPVTVVLRRLPGNGNHRQQQQNQRQPNYFPLPL